MQSVFAIEPISSAARDWIRDSLLLGSWQWVGNSVVVEHRYIADIIAGMLESGLKQFVDFRVR